ncbi:hypothetical protein C8R44DRAFT_755650 [Mycena epipterygia]|nr:hypothetical protein C8R44DRAFT_755650 [Mycena epipterygia]
MSSPTSTALTVTSRHIPSEIWTEIFAQLPREVLMHVALTHGLFHRITRPLLFRDFEFHPYTTIPGYYLTHCPPSRLSLPDVEPVDYLLQRLQFWFSADIAPFVRTCRVTSLVFTAGVRSTSSVITQSRSLNSSRVHFFIQNCLFHDILT